MMDGVGAQARRISPACGSRVGRGPSDDGRALPREGRSTDGIASVLLMLATQLSGTVGGREVLEE